MGTVELYDSWLYGQLFMRGTIGQTAAALGVSEVQVVAQMKETDTKYRKRMESAGRMSKLSVRAAGSSADGFEPEFFSPRPLYIELREALPYDDVMTVSRLSKALVEGGVSSMSELMSAPLAEIAALRGVGRESMRLVRRLRGESAFSPGDIVRFQDGGAERYSIVRNVGNGSVGGSSVGSFVLINDEVESGRWVRRWIQDSMCDEVALKPCPLCKGACGEPSFELVERDSSWSASLKCPCGLSYVCDGHANANDALAAFDAAWNVGRR